MRRMLLRINRVIGPATLGILLILSGCASAPAPKPLADDHRAKIESLMLGDIGRVDDKALEGYLKTDTELEQSPRHGLRTLRSRQKAQAAIPKEIDARVRWWIYYYAIREHVLFQRMLDRGEQYRAMITGVLNEHLMPAELYNLAMIESGFVVHAESNAEAVGIWQFIPGTATRYGLHVDSLSDDRHHPLMATEAAARHLLDLRRRFKSWYLVLAAYNAGPERIAKAMKRGKSVDFWELARKHKLPSETMDYIPKFMAAVILSTHYDKFGFNKPVPPHPYPELVAVKVKPGMTLAQLARKGSIELSMLKRVNPQLINGVIPPQARRAEVWVPAQQAEEFRMAISFKPHPKRALSMAKTEPANHSTL